MTQIRLRMSSSLCTCGAVGNAQFHNKWSTVSRYGNLKGKTSKVKVYPKQNDKSYEQFVNFKILNFKNLPDEFFNRKDSSDSRRQIFTKMSNLVYGLLLLHSNLTKIFSSVLLGKFFDFGFLRKWNPRKSKVRNFASGSVSRKEFFVSG